MKKTWIAVQIKENERFYAYMLPVTECDNVLSKLEIKNIITANIYPTKKRAAEIVTAWNNAYKENGTYLFDTPAF